MADVTVICTPQTTADACLKLYNAVQPASQESNFNYIFLAIIVALIIGAVMGFIERKSIKKRIKELEDLRNKTDKFLLDVREAVNKHTSQLINHSNQIKEINEKSHKSDKPTEVEPQVPIQ